MIFTFALAPSLFLFPVLVLATELTGLLLLPSVLSPTLPSLSLDCWTGFNYTDINTGYTLIEVAILTSKYVFMLNILKLSLINGHLKKLFSVILMNNI